MSLLDLAFIKIIAGWVKRWENTFLIIRILAATNRKQKGLLTKKEISVSKTAHYSFSQYLILLWHVYFKRSF